MYLARERSAAISKIAFDLRLDTTEAARIIHELSNRGLVREANSGPMRKSAVQSAAPGQPAYYILSESGLEAVKPLLAKSAWS